MTLSNKLAGPGAMPLPLNDTRAATATHTAATSDTDAAAGRRSSTLDDGKVCGFFLV